MPKPAPRPITQLEVMPLVVEACPSFAASWATYRAQEEFEAELVYEHLGEFAHHLVELLKANATSEFPAVFKLAERLHLEGDEYVKEAATIGLLEGLQNVAANSGVDPNLFAPFLGPESRKWWKELDDFWVQKGKAATKKR